MMRCGECRKPLREIPRVLDGQTFMTWAICADHPKAGYWWKGERYVSPREMRK